MKTIPKILYVARDDGGCGFYRCVQPAKFLKRMGLAETEVVLNKPTEKQLMESDLVIMQEMGSANASNIARFCIEHKIAYMTEFDDFIQHVSPRNVWGYQAWNPSTLYAHRAMEMSRAAFAIQVSTNWLAREYYPYNPTIFVIPNFLDKERWAIPTSKKQDGKIRIGWMGGNAHADDLHMVSKVIEKLVKESKGKIVFETLGMVRSELAGVFPMPDSKPDSCPSCGFEGQLHHFPGESLDDYPAALASKGWDIAIAPVISNAFGNAKSDIKIKEYAAVGMPIVASPVAPYVEAKKNGAQLILADTFDEWYNGLRELIRSPKKREEMARSNREWIEKNWIQENAQNIFEVYRQIISKAESVLGKKENRII